MKKKIIERNDYRLSCETFKDVMCQVAEGQELIFENYSGDMSTVFIHGESKYKAILQNKGRSIVLFSVNYEVVDVEEISDNIYGVVNIEDVFCFGVSFNQYINRHRFSWNRDNVINIIEGAIKERILLKDKEIVI
mgnify:CR=1 FL=1